MCDIYCQAVEVCFFLSESAATENYSECHTLSRQAALPSCGLSGGQDWKGGAADEHAAHGHGSMVMADHSGEAAPAVPLARIVEHARAEHMPAPAIVQPPEIGRAHV